MSEQPDSQPLVSVIMAMYKGDSFAFVKEAVDSVLHQSHRNVELLAVADGPLSVECQAFINERARHDARVVLLALPENRGPGAARNLGILRARGSYIAILDADDRCAPERIAQQIAFIESTGADVAGSAFRIIDRRGNVTGEKRFPLEADAIRKAMYLYNPIANSTVLARAEVLKRNPYPETYRYGEDYALWIALARAGYVLRNQPERLIDFRIDPAFYSRRRGVHHATTELMNRLHTCPLYQFYFWPIVLAAACVLAAVRLLPGTLLAPFYAARERMN